MSLSLKKRRDNRDVEVFADNIQDYTTRENIYGEALALFFEEKGKDWEVFNWGERSGELILGKLPEEEASDKGIRDSQGKEHHIEIKTVPDWCKRFQTFKTNSLVKCIKKEMILVVCNTSRFWMFFPKTCTQMLQYHPAKIYWGFSPNDPAVRIDIADIENLVDVKHAWDGKSLKLVKKHKKTLIAEKRK